MNYFIICQKDREIQKLDAKFEDLLEKYNILQTKFIDFVTNSNTNEKIYSSTLKKYISIIEDLESKILKLEAENNDLKSNLKIKDEKYSELIQEIFECNK